MDEDLRYCVMDSGLEKNFESLNNNITISIELTKNSAIRAQTLFLLIQEAFEAMSTKECEEWFKFIESNTDHLHQILSTTNDKNANGHAVRALAGLLRRLSKTNDVLFCGRILLSLSRIMPLLDPSGVNSKGLINRANITNIQPSDDNDFMVGVEDIGKLDKEGEDVSIDFQFHQQFWSMVQYFQDPEKAVSTEQHWETASHQIKQVLKVFTSITSLQNEEGTDVTASDVSFIKFLTSPKLIQLEVQDPYFRRHILIQLLIFCQAVKKSSLKSNETTLNEMKSTMEEFEKKAKSLIEKTSSNGKKISAAISHILKREENWINWKKDGCVSFERFEKDSKVQKTHKRPLEKSGGEEEASKNKKVKVSLGNELLDNLWNQPTTIEDFEGPPDVQHFLAPAIEELKSGDFDPASKIVDGKIFQWKAHRMLRQNFDMMVSLSNSSLGDVILTPQLFELKQESDENYKQSEKTQEKTPEAMNTSPSPALSRSSDKTKKTEPSTTKSEVKTVKKK
uniref:THO complex subunit 1 n=1 Tax=Arcella intermedia TaxID=1963864 RepID=A0A6B2L1W3_9EUKA